MQNQNEEKKCEECMTDSHCHGMNSFSCVCNDCAASLMNKPTPPTVEKKFGCVHDDINPHIKPLKKGEAYPVQWNDIPDTSMNTIPPTEESMDERFDKEFVIESQGNIIWDFVENGKHITHLKIKSFIKQEIEKEKRMLLHKILLELSPGNMSDDYDEHAIEVIKNYLKQL